MHLEMLVVILLLKAIREENIPAGRRPRTFTVVAQVEAAQVALDLIQQQAQQMRPAGEV
jgi:hypothetical protein